MSTQELYVELKEDVAKLTDPLFDSSELFIKKRGNFLPHGAILLRSGEIHMVNFAPDDFERSKSSSVEILAGLHNSLREAVKMHDTVATAIAEDVTISSEGKTTQAVKVLIEHERGLNIALYLPCKKKLFGGVQTGSTILLEAEPEVCCWTE